MFVRRVVATALGGVNVMLDNGGPNHGHTGHKKANGNALDRCERYMAALQKGVYKESKNRDKNDKEDRVQHRSKLLRRVTKV